MKIEIYPDSIHTSDHTRLYYDVALELQKNLKNTWVLKPIRDLYRECQSICAGQGYDGFEDGMQSYALVKHPECRHRTVEIIQVNRKTNKRKFIQMLKYQRSLKCSFCLQNDLYNKEKKDLADFFSFKHLWKHLSDRHKKNDCCSACQCSYYFFVDWKDNIIKSKHNREIDKKNKVLEDFEKNKFYTAKTNHWSC
jgi:hypothetical protein